MMKRPIYNPNRPTPVARAISIVGIALLVYGCSAKGFPPVEPLPGDLPEVDAVVFLIGDAGEPKPGSPILAHLKAEAAESSRGAPTAVAFLGDNAYETGLHPPGDPRREDDIRHLEAQIDVVRGSSARGIFLPGNHDWTFSGDEGIANIRRQSDFVNAAATPDVDVSFIPADACPGPVSMPLGESVLLVMIDTEWMLRYQASPSGLSCAENSTAEIQAGLTRLLSDPGLAAGRRVVVLAHHPLRTNGSHGGYFGLNDQLFPLTAIWKPLYIPVPFVYPIARNSGITMQDISSGRNTEMREALAEVFAEFDDEPFVFASGHDHNLQVFEGDGFGVGYLLVSGAGSRLKSVEKGDALFVAGAQNRELGYMRLEFFDDGRVLLTVVTDGTASCPDDSVGGCEPRAAVRFWRWLTPEAGVGAAR